jgi:hypothetical protein
LLIEKGQKRIQAEYFAPPPNDPSARIRETESVQDGVHTNVAGWEGGECMPNEGFMGMGFLLSSVNGSRPFRSDIGLSIFKKPISEWTFYMKSGIE